MAGLALVVAIGGFIPDVFSTHGVRAGEPTVVALVLPDSTVALDELPVRPGRIESGVARDVPPGSRAGSRTELPATRDDDPAAAPSHQSAVGSPDIGDEVVTGASAAGTVSGASAGLAPATAVAEDEETAAAPPVATPDHRVTVRSGDSFYLIFKRLGLPQRDLALMTGLKSLAKKLARLAPRQEIEFYVDAESRLVRLVHRLDRVRSLHVFREGDAFAFEEVVEPPEVSHATATGVIDSSLFEAGQQAGLSDRLIMQMAEIFAWDIDFALDIRAGDRFALVFEEQFKDGEKIGEGPIVAAEFVNRDRRVRAVRYTDPAGRVAYFSPDGKSMRKAFLRTPVNFTRISSRFSFSRRHPILHKIRAHRGVDYAAPRGTAVKASGNGRVVFAGRKGGYGRTIVLQHGSVYTTVYAHLSRFSKGIRPGKRVEQGQIIGYVGSSGLATGPHLHYEFRVGGVHRDPLKVKLPQAEPLAEAYMDDFRTKGAPVLAELDLVTRTAVATAN